MKIIDRRLNPGGKSLANRQRFLRRVRAQVKRAVRDATSKRSIKDVDQGGEVSVPSDGVHEPTFRRSDEGGVRERVLPGNKEFIEGDRVPRPPSGGGGGGGPEASDSGEGDDDFRFVLSRDEFVDLFLEDLELPDLAKRAVTDAAESQPVRAGYKSSGAPSALSVPRTMRNAMSRRMALRRPSAAEVEAAEEALWALMRADAPEAQIAEARETLERLKRRRALVPFLDPLDVRYRRFEQVPKPIARAVMFCLMDVSGSMDQHMKDLAKRFYALLYLFLKRRYDHVDVVFIRHTHEAKEVDEETFFYSRESGGTIVSTALEEMMRVVRDRYPADQWNIYAAQASDGDNMPSDTPKVIGMLTDQVLPLCQYYAYIEVGRSFEERLGGGSARTTGLWRAYQRILSPDLPFALRKVTHRRDIFPVFRDLFRKRDPNEREVANG